MDALEHARNQTHDAVVSEIMLPDLDRFTVCEMLRRDSGNTNTAILMMTCFGGQLSRLNGLSAGADDYLTKPVNTGDLETVEIPGSMALWVCLEEPAALQG